MSSHILGFATHVIAMAIVISIILLFLGISVLILIHVCIVGRTLRTGINSTNVNIVERGSCGNTSMSQEDIEKLPCFDFKAKEKGASPVPDCVVCLEKFTVGEKCRLLPSCNHSFHAECVDLWLLRTPICPICRAGASDLNSGSLFGEESSGFSESGIELSDQTAESGQITENVADEVAIEITGIQEWQTGTFNVNSSEVAVDVSQRLEIVDPIRNSFPESQTRENTMGASEEVNETIQSQELEIDNASEMLRPKELDLSFETLNLLK